MRRSTTQQQEPRGLWDSTLNLIAFNSGTMTQPPLGLPPSWCLFSQSLPFPEPIWGILHIKAKVNFGSSGLLKKVAECTTYQPRDKTAKSAGCAVHYHNLMPNTSKEQRDNYLQSLWAFTRSLCVVGNQNHLWNWASKRAESQGQGGYDRESSISRCGNTVNLDSFSPSLLLALPLHMWWNYPTSIEAGRWFGQ